MAHTGRMAEMCKQCGQRPALAVWRQNGRTRVSAFADHDLCDRCWRSLRDSVRSDQLKPKRLEPHQAQALRVLERRGVVSFRGSATHSAEGVDGVGRHAFAALARMGLADREQAAPWHRYRISELGRLSLAELAGPAKQLSDDPPTP